MYSEFFLSGFSITTAPAKSVSNDPGRDFPISPAAEAEAIISHAAAESEAVLSFGSPEAEDSISHASPEAEVVLSHGAPESSVEVP